MWLPAATLLLAAGAASAAQPAEISWLSQPVRANSTVLVAGAGFGAGVVRLRSKTTNETQSLKATSVTAGAASFVLPSGGSVEHPCFAVSIDGSNELFVNDAEVWWYQGDLGRDASVGGALHVFGRAIAANNKNTSAAGESAAAHHQQLERAIERGDVAEAQRLAGELAGAAERQQQRLGTDPAAAVLPTLQLRLIGGSAGPPGPAVVLRATPSATGQYRATFPLPASIAPGVYEGELRSPVGSVASLSMFSSPEAPRNTRVTVRAARSAVTAKTINVGDYCSIGFDCGVVGTNSSAPLLAAMRDAAAAVAAGAARVTVWLPRGQWYLNHSSGAVILPPNTTLQGEARDLVAVYMPEQQKHEAPFPAYFTMASTNTSTYLPPRNK